MRILLIHNYYQQRGGEDAVFEQEYNLLKEDNEVFVLSFYNLPGWGGALQFLISIWNVGSSMKVEKAISNVKPDIVHLHNWHFACGPRMIRTISKMKVPIVITLHNYRLLCPSGTLLLKGKIFTESINAKFPWSAVKFKVYRGSFVLTFWLAFITWFHKVIGTWRLIDKFIVLTPFAENLFRSSSTLAKVMDIVVKPNFVELQQVSSLPVRNGDFLFIGRLSEEKGIRILLDAFNGSQFNLRIAGDGPMLNDVLIICETSPNIKYLGILDKEMVRTEMQTCAALVFPSIWFEGMPMTILESFSQSMPIIASRLGAMELIISDGENGFHFEAGNSASLIKTLNSFHCLSVDEHITMQEKAFKAYYNLYTREGNKKQLLEIYRSILHRR
jgi:glycosyltransferase involved in cell wall biosynthesis